MNKKFCTNCGKEVTGRFCTNCGKEIAYIKPQMKNYVPGVKEISVIPNGIGKSLKGRGILTYVGIGLLIAYLIFVVVCGFWGFSRSVYDYNSQLLLSPQWHSLSLEVSKVWFLLFLIIHSALVVKGIRKAIKGQSAEVRNIILICLIPSTIALLVTFVAEPNYGTAEKILEDMVKHSTVHVGIFNRLSFYIGAIGYSAGAILGSIFWIPSLILFAVKAAKKER